MTNLGRTGTPRAEVQVNSGSLYGEVNDFYDGDAPNCPEWARGYSIEVETNCGLIRRIRSSNMP